MNISIMAIGNEILSGSVDNKNASNFSSILLSYNARVKNNIIVNDDLQDIQEHLKNFENSLDDILFITGGLGPTKDDLTRFAIAEYFNFSLEINVNVLNKIKNLFLERGLEYNDINNVQALFFKEAVIIENNLGTAAGFYFKIKNKIICVLPGPPNENIPMFKYFCHLFLKKKESFKSSYHLKAISESSVDDLIKDVYKLPHVHIGVYTKLYGLVYVFETNSLQQLKDLENCFESIVSDYIVFKGDDIYLYVHELLLNSNLTISTIESCTCGLLGYNLSKYSGASKYYQGSIVAYANDVKTNFVNVLQSTLEKYGAVSQECISEMLENPLNTSICIATSGIAGPTGGSIDKPVGLVEFGIFYGKKYFFSCEFRGSREEVQKKAVYFILLKLIEILDN